MLTKSNFVLLFCLSCSSLFFAQNDSLSFNLEDIIIKSNRIQIPFSETSRSIEIITAAQLQAAPVESVAEVLQYYSGMDIRQRGVHGVQADVSIRGGTFEQALIMINGIKMVDPQTGHHALNIPVNLQDIERIEILKGPGARIYGQNAFSGAINIITKKHTERIATVSLSAGENNTGGFGFSAALPGDKNYQHLSFNRNFSEGYKFNTDYNISNFFYQSNFKLSTNNDINVTAGFVEKEFGANGFYASPDFMDQYEETQTSIVAVELNNKNSNQVIKPRLYWRRNQDEYHFVRSNPSIYRNLHINNTVGLECNTLFFNKFGTTGVGVDFQTIRLQSNNLGIHNRQVASAFLEHRFSLLNNALDITPGLSFNYFSDFGSNFLPGIDVGYAINNHVKLFVNAGYTYRTPSFTDLYYSDPVNIGNAALLPESAFTYEGGIKVLKNNHAISISYFNRTGNNQIDWTKNLEEDPWQPQNFQTVIMKGIDANIQIDLTNSLKRKSWLRLAYTFIDSEIPANENQFSRYALENLKHQVIGGMSINIFSKLHYSIFARYNDRVTMDDYTVLDTKLTWQSDRFTAYLKANNLTDEKYLETNLVEMPGRWILGGVQWRFRY